MLISHQYAFLRLNFYQNSRRIEQDHGKVDGQTLSSVHLYKHAPTIFGAFKKDGPNTNSPLSQTLHFMPLTSHQ